MARSVFSLCALLIVLVTADGVKFDCPALPPLTQPAKNVYELKPQDIKVVMALGDSITAGERRSAPTCSRRYFILSLSCCRVWNDGQTRIRHSGRLARIQGKAVRLKKNSIDFFCTGEFVQHRGRQRRSNGGNVPAILHTRYHWKQPRPSLGRGTICTFVQLCK